MSGTRGGIGRIVAMGIALALALLLLVGERGERREVRRRPVRLVRRRRRRAGPTRPAGAKFRQDGWCVPPPDARIPSTAPT